MGRQQYRCLCPGDSEESMRLYKVGDRVQTKVTLTYTPKGAWGTITQVRVTDSFPHGLYTVSWDEYVHTGSYSKATIKKL
jgi:hypothetical protein